MYEGPPSFEKPEIMPPLDEIKQVLKELPNLEKEPEHIPTLEEVRSLFMKLINKEHVEILRREDEEGNLYYLEAKTVKDSEGKIDEYFYQRAGHYGMNQSPDTVISIVSHHEGDSDEVDPDSYDGAILAECVDGKWEIL